MINIKSKTEIEKMKASGKIVAEVLREIEKNIFPGITTKELDRIAAGELIPGTEKAIKKANKEKGAKLFKKKDKE